MPVDKSVYPLVVEFFLDSLFLHLVEQNLTVFHLARWAGIGLLQLAHNFLFTRHGLSVEEAIFISECQHSMKQKLIIGLLLVGVLLAAGLTTNITKANPPNHRQAAAILVVFKGTYGARLPDGRLPQLGLEIDWAQSSVGAPVLPPGYPAAQVIADLTTQGYQYQVVAVNYWLFIK